MAGLVDANVEGYGIEASIAKLPASDLAMKMAVEAVQMPDGYGFIKGYPVGIRCVMRRSLRSRKAQISSIGN